LKPSITTGVSSRKQTTIGESWPYSRSERPVASSKSSRAGRTRAANAPSPRPNPPTGGDIASIARRATPAADGESPRPAMTVPCQAWSLLTLYVRSVWENHHATRVWPRGRSKDASSLPDLPGSVQSGGPITSCDGTATPPTAASSVWQPPGTPSFQSNSHPNGPPQSQLAREPPTAIDHRRPTPGIAADAARILTAAYTKTAPRRSMHCSSSPNRQSCNRSLRSSRGRRTRTRTWQRTGNKLSQISSERTPHVKNRVVSVRPSVTCGPRPKRTVEREPAIQNERRRPSDAVAPPSGQIGSQRFSISTAKTGTRLKSGRIPLISDYVTSGKIELQASRARIPHMMREIPAPKPGAPAY